MSPHLIMFYQAGLRTLQDAGPELTRAVSGNLAPDDNNAAKSEVEPDHRVNHCLHAGDFQFLFVIMIFTEISFLVWIA